MPYNNKLGRHKGVLRVKLVFIYGIPATGKLTIGRELARLTGLKLYHNHLAIDLALSFFEYDNPYFMQLCERINFDVFDIVKKAQLEGVIFTHAISYVAPLDDPFIEAVIGRYNNEVYFVHLFCDSDELLRRVVNIERGKYRKVRDPNIVQAIIDDIDYDKDISHPNHLVIDTTNLSPQDAARCIVEYYQL